MKQAVREQALALGFDECRFAAAAPPVTAPQFLTWLNNQRHGEMGYLERNATKRIDPQLVLPGANTVIVVAASYATREECRPTAVAAPGLASRPSLRAHHPGTIARYTRFEDYHTVMGERLKQLAGFVDRLGGPETRSLWYVDTGPVLEREFAQRAGLGFVGKHTYVISRQLGNWLLLAEILTTLPLEPDPPEKNRCGACARCLAACPTGALIAPFQLDARLCLSYLTIELKGSIPLDLRPKIGTRIFGCDDCLAACPWNRFAREARLMKPHARPELGTPDLLDLLSLTEAGFRQRFAGTAVTRTKRRGLLRNVCVALGNSGDASALPALERACHDPEPLIAEHAGWAISQIRERATADRPGP